MKEPNNFDEIVPGRPTATELRAMALRQQQQIDSQHQLLAAKEQRLRFLKTQEARGVAAAAEGERLRRLRERVEVQESKLRRLRALRGQVDLQKTYNATLSNDLDSIRALFSEKEKELSLAVAKVEALTKQLEELRRDRRGPLNLIPGCINGNQQLSSSPAAKELEKLRRELMYRNQLSLQQDARLHLQREALQQRQAELRSVDQRILELQTRLQRKKASNTLLANNTNNNQNTIIITNLNNGNSNISNTNINSNHMKNVNANIVVSSAPSQLPKLQNHSNNTNSSTQIRKSTNVYPQSRILGRGNIAAIEPFNHSPQKVTPAVNQTSNNTKFQSTTISNKNNSNNNTNNNTIGEQNVSELDTHKTTSKLIQDLTNFTLGQEQSTVALNLNNIQTHPESDEIKLARQKLQENFEDLEKNIANDFGGKKSDPKYQTLPYNTKFGLKISPSNKTNECDSEKAGEIDNKTIFSTTVNPTINKSSAVSIPIIQKQVAEEEKPLIKPKMKHQIPSGNLVVPPRKPVNSVAPTHAPKTNVKVHVVTPIANVSNKIEENKNIGDTPTSPRPALPPKPNKQSSIMQSYAENNQNLDNVPTIVSLISKTSSSSIPNDNSSQDSSSSSSQISSSINPSNILQDNLPIKAKPLTIKKQPFHEQPRLKSFTSGIKPIQYISRRIEMPPSFLFPEVETVELKEKNIESSNNSSIDETDKSSVNISNSSVSGTESVTKSDTSEVIRRTRHSSLSSDHANTAKLSRRVSFDPLALLLDASLEGELELVKKTAMQVTNPSAANDEGITALHNAICAGHFEIVKFLVEFGCDVNAQDSDGWTPLHCAASCNNLAMVKFLVESGACLFASTMSDHETPAEKCEEDEEGFDGCSEYLYSIQEKLGILNNGEVYAVFSYEAQLPDELSFTVNDRLIILRKGDDSEREWWWAKNSSDKEGYVPRNLFGLYPRIAMQNHSD